MSKTKKIILLVSMVAILVVAAILNVTILTGKQNDDGTQVQPTASFFATSRTDRQSTRDYEISELNSIIAMEGDEYSEARSNALLKKQNIVDAMETETLLETLLKAQGFEDVLVTCSATGNNISVIVEKDELTRADTAKIYNTIASETGTSVEYIKILSV